ncbi:MAG: FtsX-like permease family protein [Euryarchaeota archaeon]|nr:FtsX-like permease family protein [Euryarchaeota archaeon]
MVLLTLLPSIFAPAIILLLTILFVLIDAIRNRILFNISIRNVIRRPGTTALVLAGLMVGTAIISATLVVSDTFDNMIVGEITETYGESDFFIKGSGENNGLYSISEVESISEDIRGIHGIQSADWFLRTSSGITNKRSELGIPDPSIFGLSDDAVKNLGGFKSHSGISIENLPSAGHVYVNEKLAHVLDIEVGDIITLNKILNYEEVRLELIVEAVVANHALGGLTGGRNIYLDMDDAQQLIGDQDLVNYLAVALTNDGRNDPGPLRNTIESIIESPSYAALKLEISGDRAQIIEDGREGVSMFTSLFFVFGSFSIIAGIVLIINIFTMLGEERKSEMGISRAVGMQRSHLRKLFIYEGFIYALVTAAIGTFVGLLLAYGLINAVGMVMDLGTFDISKYFTFTTTSILLAYLAGFLLTIVTIYGVTRRISNMNIVRAIRNIPEPIRPRNDKKALLLGLLSLLFGVLVMFVGVSAESLGPALGGLSIATISMGLIIRRFVGDRIAWTVAGLTTLLLWMPGVEIFPYDGNLEMFVIAGVFMVTALSMVVMFNSDLIAAVLTRLLRVKNGYKAVFKTALSYPQRVRGRTAMSMFIFGLVIFTITTLSMMSGMLGVGIPKMLEETSGGFDIIAISSAPIDMRNEIETAGGIIDSTNIEDIIQLTMGYSTFTFSPLTDNDEASKEVYYNAIGIESSLYERGHYPLANWNHTKYSNEKDVWLAVQQDPTLVILDGSANSNEMSGTGISINVGPFHGVAIGDQIIMNNSTGGSHALTVAAFMEQSAFSGAYMSKELVKSSTEADGSNLFMIKLVDDTDVEKYSVLLQNRFLPQQLITIPISAIAKEAVSQVNGIFDLIKAFLAMGLIIGITGLGIITMRSIHERRIEIGMMRAIGYTKRMIVTNFTLESSFVAVLGVFIGTTLGIITGYLLWDGGFSAMGIDFMIAWKPILLVDAIALLATLVTVIPAARGASRVSPAEVLRFE